MEIDSLGTRRIEGHRIGLKVTALGDSLVRSDCGKRKIRPEKVAAAGQAERVVATRPGYRRARGLPPTRVQRRPRSLPQMVETTPPGGGGRSGRAIPVAPTSWQSVTHRWGDDHRHLPSRRLVYQAARRGRTSPCRHASGQTDGDRRYGRPGRLAADRDGDRGIAGKRVPGG